MAPSASPLKERLEAQGKAPVLGWADDRKVPIDLSSTDVRKTWANVARVAKKRPVVVTPPA